MAVFIQPGQQKSAKTSFQVRQATCQRIHLQDWEWIFCTRLLQYLVTCHRTLPRTGNQQVSPTNDVIFPSPRWIECKCARTTDRRGGGTIMRSLKQHSTLVCNLYLRHERSSWNVHSSPGITGVVLGFAFTCWSLSFLVVHALSYLTAYLKVRTMFSVDPSNCGCLGAVRRWERPIPLS